jgi:hypothetical protein
MIKKILTEWSYRLDDGIINLNNPKHLLILSEVLKDMKLPTKVILEVMGNLTEKEKVKPLSDKDKQKMRDMGLIWKGKGYGKEGEKGILYKNVDGKLVKSGDAKTQKTKPKVNVFPTDKPADTTKEKPKKETSAQKKRRREERNKNDDRLIKQSDSDDIVLQLMQKRRKEINEMKDLPQGTPGSTLGEKAGGEAFEQISKNPDLTEDEFVDNEYEKIKDTPLGKELKRKAELSGISPEKYIKSWLRVGYKTGKNEYDYLKNEPKFKFKEPQSKPYPISGVMDYNQKQLVISTLEKKRDEAKTPEERAHYQKQLDYVRDLEDTDTGVLYETTDGTIGFKHTSNKKGWKAPHNNTSVAKKGELITKFVNDMNLDNETKEKVNKTTTEAVKKASNTVDNAEQVVEDDTKKLPEGTTKPISKLLGFVDPRDKNYIDEAKKEPSVIKQLEKMGIDPSTATPEQITEAVIQLCKEGKAPQNVKKLILKVSDLVSRIRKLNKEGLKKYGGPMSVGQIAEHLDIGTDIVNEALSGELDDIVDTSRKRKNSMEVAHEQLVSDLQKGDTDLDPDSFPSNPDGDNGPNQQSYINSFMEEIHFNRYIDGDLEGIQSINIDGTVVEPKHFRECLKELSGFEGDTETKEGREALKEHLRKKLRISPDKESISFSGKDGEKENEIGTESYRTKGNAKGVLAHLGKDMIECLQGKTEK